MQKTLALPDSRWALVPAVEQLRNANTVLAERFVSRRKGFTDGTPQSSRVNLLGDYSTMSSRIQFQATENREG
jgi:hypothetical protein